MDRDASTPFGPQQRGTFTFFFLFGRQSLPPPRRTMHLITSVCKLEEASPPIPMAIMHLTFITFTLIKSFGNYTIRLAAAEPSLLLGAVTQVLGFRHFELYFSHSINVTVSE